MVLALNGSSLHVLETMRIPFAGIIQGFEMQRVTDFHSTVLCVSLMIDGGKIRFPSQCFEASRNLEFLEQLNALKITIICVIVATKGPYCLDTQKASKNFRQIYLLHIFL